MKKEICKLFALLVFVSIIPLSSTAQEINTLYYMDRIPQMSLMNPARQPVSNGYLSLPVISDINMNVGNNTLTYDDIIMESPVSDSLITFLHPDANKDNFLNTLKPQNDIFTQVSTNILGFGFRADDNYFSFHIRGNSAMKVSYPKDLVGFMMKGNTKGENTDFSNLNLFTDHYLEYSFGYAGQTTQNLSFGVRLKYLNGLFNLQTKDFNLSLYTSKMGDSLSLTSDIEIQSMAPIEIDTGSVDLFKLPSFDILPGEAQGWPPVPYEEEDTDKKGIGLPPVSYLFKNPGFALDFGVNYRIMDNLELSASVNDLGFINYSNYNHQYTNNGQFSYTGVDVSSEFREDSDSDPAGDLLDSLQEATKLNYTEEGFLHFLGPKIFVGGNYQLTRKVDFGFLSRTTFFGGDVNQSFTLSANTRPIPGVSFSASYSVMNRAFNNLGLGVGLRLGPFQVYTVSDVVSAGLWPGHTKAFNLRLGLNLVFGANRMKRIMDDEPMIR